MKDICNLNFFLFGKEDFERLPPIEVLMPGRTIADPDAIRQLGETFLAQREEMDRLIDLRRAEIAEEEARREARIYSPNRCC